MKITNLFIKGFRTFGAKEGITFNNINESNLLIGANNVGKSNVLRLLKRVREVLPEESQGLGEFSDKSDTILKRGMELEKDFLESDFVIKSDKRISNIINVIITIDNVEIIIYVSKKKGEIYLVAKKDKRFLKITEYIKYVHFIRQSFIFIDEIRNPAKSKLPIQDSFLGENCGEIITERVLDDIALGAPIQEWKWDEFKEFMETSLYKITSEKFLIDRKLSKIIEAFDDLNELEENEIEIIEKEFNPIKDLLFYQGGNCFTLHELGTGIGQIVLLLSAGFTFKGSKEKKIIFIEEPENHLHPNALIKLFQIMKSQENQYFIITHSPWLIDRYELVNQMYFINKKDGYSLANPIYNNHEQTSIMLDIIGVRPSQLLQSNCVIWVEGPSDRIYIKHWLSLIACEQNINLVEGRHFSFILYSGTLLNYYNIDNQQDLINLLSTSRYSYIVCDSDISDKRPNLKPIVRELREQISKTENIDIWITEGKEIENYIPSFFLRKIFIKNNDFVKRGMDKLNIKGKMFTKEQPFNKYFAQLYVDRSIRDAEEIEGRIKKQSRDNRIFNKPKLAKTVIKDWDNLHSPLKLRKEIEKLMDFIKKANGII